VGDDPRRYPSRVLASEDHGAGTPPADPAPSRRVSSSSKRAATARRRAIVGGIAALVIAGGAVWLFTGGGSGDGPLGPLGDIIDSGPETPEFAFEVRRVVPESTTETRSSDLQREADDVADQVKATLDELYFDGFVETDTWGDFGEIEDLFDGEARAQAEADLDTLTLGTSGSETFTFVTPEGGSLVIDVLTDQGDRPVQALAFVKFRGVAEAEDGSLTEVRSDGSFFLHHVEGGWKIYAYRIERGDRPARAPSETGSATASASPADDGEAEG
jgi:hypothetical protein